MSEFWGPLTTEYHDLSPEDMKLLNLYSDEEEYDYSHFDGIFDVDPAAAAAPADHGVMDNANVAKFTCHLPRLEAGRGRVRLFVDLNLVSTDIPDEIELATYAALVPQVGFIFYGQWAQNILAI